MDEESRRILDEARGVEIPIIVTVDGDEYTMKWSESADDGSGYGCPGWADENGMSCLEEDFEAARWPEDTP